MKCNSARKILYVSEYPEVVSSELLDARRHLRECSECRAFFEGEETFGLRLRNSIGKDNIPPELNALVSRLQGRKGGIFKGLYRRLAIVAAVLFLVITGYIVTIDKNSSPIIRQIVSDHIQFLPSPDMQISSSDPAEIRAWFRGKVDFSVNVPQISATLRGGRLCFLDGKRLALLFYEHKSIPISVFVTGDPGVYQSKNAKKVTVKGKKMRRVEDRGYNFLSWQEGGLTYALVSELRLEEIEKLI